MLQNFWQFLVGLAICVAGLVILWLDVTSSANTVANTGSYFFQLGLMLTLAGGIWAVMQVKQALGLAKPEQPSDKAAAGPSRRFERT